MRFLLFLVVLLPVAHLLTAGEPPRSGKVYIDSRPQGADVYWVTVDTTGFQHRWVGRTPGPLALDYPDFPAQLVFRLPLYRDEVVKVPGQVFSPATNTLPQTVGLEPVVPLVAPLLQAARRAPFLALTVVPLVGLGVLAWRERRRSTLSAAFLERAERGRLEPGDELHGYRIGRVLGRGGMGTVYEVEREGRRLALKVLHFHLVDNPSARRRFEAEIELWRELSHPNIAHLYDWGALGRLVYLVSDLVEGKPLPVDRPQSPEQVEAWGRQAAAALAYAHVRGIVHRDVKPSNLMLEGDRVRLVDFGVAARLGASGEAVGTPGYAAPEQLQGREPDGRADFYSLAVVLGEALLGRRLFPGSTPEEVLARQLEGAPSVGDPRLEAFLAPDPEERPSAW